MDFVSDGRNRHVELVGDTDSETVRIHAANGEMDITIFGNGEIQFSFPDDATGEIVKTKISAFTAWLNGHAVS